MADDLKDTLSTAAPLQRRSLLKGTAGILAAGVFPAVHSADPIVLRYLGTDTALPVHWPADVPPAVLTVTVCAGAAASSALAYVGASSRIGLVPRLNRPESAGLRRVSKASG